MSKELITALLLSYAAAVGVNVTRTPSWAKSKITRAIWIPLGLGSIIAGWLSVYILVKSSGLAYGLVSFALFGVFSFWISTKLDDGVMSLLGLICLTTGLGLFAFS